MINVRTSGFRNRGRETTYSLETGSTIADLAQNLLINDPNSATFFIDGTESSLSSTLYDGAFVVYAQKNIKGA